MPAQLEDLETVQVPRRLAQRELLHAIKRILDLCKVPHLVKKRHDFKELETGVL